MLRILVTLIIICNLLNCDAQVVDTTLYRQLDSTLVSNVDSTNVKKPKKERKEFFVKTIWKEPYPSPRKAALFSVILPGAGQAYNKKYWKIPLVLGAVGGTIYAIDFNGKGYRRWRDQYKFRVDGDDNTVDNFVGILSDDAIRNIREDWFKDYQLSYVGFGVVYLLNAVEAFVDAHLLSFNVDDDLSLQLYPNTQIMHDGRTAFSLGISLHETKTDLEIHPGFIGLWK